MVRTGAEVLRDVPFQVPFHVVRGLAVREAQPVGNTVNVGVHGDDGLVIDDGGDDVGGFAADAGQASMSDGTSPPKSASSFCAIAIRCSVLEFG